MDDPLDTEVSAEDFQDTFCLIYTQAIDCDGG